MLCDWFPSDKSLGYFRFAPGGAPMELLIVEALIDQCKRTQSSLLPFFGNMRGVYHEKEASLVNHRDCVVTGGRDPRATARAKRCANDRTKCETLRGRLWSSPIAGPH
jgi:hypothetical protein